MDFTNEHEQIRNFVAELQEEETLDLVKTLVEKGDDPLAIIHAFQKGMQEVGKLYQTGHYFISGLIMAGEILRQVVEIVQPKLDIFTENKGSGHVLLGTVEGDIHNLGKEITKILFSCNGFKVTDLGVDVPAETFLEKTISHQPDVIGISSLIAAGFDGLKRTVSLIREESHRLSPMPLIIIGGAQLDNRICDYVGADYWTQDALDGLKICLDNVNPNLER